MIDWHPVPVFFVGLLVGFWGLAFMIDFSGACESKPHTVTVEAFTTDLTITIQCSGDCDLAAMIVEAREAAEK